ncbi:MAG TPA: NAD(P)-dependent oxidoreductase [Pseudomonadales bacterium]
MSPSLPRVLLTGATGFIGRHLERHLLERGWRVRVLVRPQNAARARLDGRSERHVAELTDVDALSHALADVGAVVYAAGSVRGSRYDAFRTANVDGVEALVRALRGRDEPPPHVLLISSLAATRPELSDYARSKRCGEEVLRRANDLGWTILRPPAVYGPGDRELAGLFALIRRGVALRPGPPQQRLALLHVHDLARAVVAALERPEACRHGCYEIDDGKPGGYDWPEIAQAIAGRRVLEVGVPARLLRGVGEANRLAARVFRYAPMLTPGKVRELQQPRWLCDNSPFSDATGWHPQITLEQGAASLSG